MFFLVRSAVCIGIVVALLLGRSGPAAVPDLVASTQAAASAEARRYCMEHDGDCIAAGAKIAGWFLGPDGPPPLPPLRPPASIETTKIVQAWVEPKAHPGR